MINLGIPSYFGTTTLKKSLGFAGAIFDPSLDQVRTTTVSPWQRVVDSTASSSSLEPFPAKKQIEELLYDAKALAKKFTSEVSTRIKDDWRKQLYKQLDSVLDADEWMDGDIPLAQGSFRTFVRLMLIMRPHIKPGLGLTPDGQLMAVWQTGEARLTVYCFEDDDVRYVLSYALEQRRRTAAGDASIYDLSAMIAPFRPEQWFGRESD